MSNRFDDETEMVTAIGRLPRSLPPGRDLWPGIEQRLSEHSPALSSGHRRSAWYKPALAAALVAAFAAGIVLGRQWGPEAPVLEQNPLSANRDLLAATLASEREYQAAFRQFIPLGMAPSMLGQQAVENIEGSWLELQQAETALLAALEEHPENSYLNQRLLDLRARQLEFMKQIATLDQFSRRKT